MAGELGDIVRRRARLAGFGDAPSAEVPVPDSSRNAGRFGAAAPQLAEILLTIGEGRCGD
jgi:hypothetical protein